MKITENTTLKELFAENKEIRNFLINLSSEYEVLKIDEIVDLIKTQVTITDLALKGNLSTADLIKKIENFAKK